MLFVKERARRIAEELEGLIYPQRVKIESYRYIKTRKRFSEVSSLCTNAWQLGTREELWGGDKEYFWFDIPVEIPPQFAGKCVVLELRTGREGEWDAVNPQFSAYVDGELRQGLDVNHRQLLLTECAGEAEKHRIILSAFTGDHNLYLLMDLQLKTVDRAVEKYYYDISVPLAAAELMGDGWERETILKAVHNSINCLDLRRPGSEAFYDSLRAGEECLEKGIYEKEGVKNPVEVCCVGHTHIDVAWLWTLAVTEDKAVRSFSTVLELMRRYPEYKFMSSQPQLYQYVKKNAPQIYEQIKERVKEGRWETEGGMFVEADCNVTSGESLVRQFLYGKRFFKEEFGRDSEILWLPDVFGYSAALPQIMKRAGIRYFMTTKISWSEFDKMPHDTFLWEGIDGTAILTHFITAKDYLKDPFNRSFDTTYNGQLAPSQIMGGWQRYSDKDLNGTLLMAYGFGDGGGGPTESMLENQRRLSRGIPGCPVTKTGTAAEFFHQLEEEVMGNPHLARWTGELYVQNHRGTYTSMARNKKANRKAEFAWQNTEWLAVLDEQINGTPYPAEMFREVWEVLLRNQFHDILPGSSIKEVYEDSREEYAKCEERNRRITQEILHRLAKKLSGPGKGLLVFNPNGFPDRQLVKLDWEEEGVPRLLDDGEILPVQKAFDGGWLVYTGTVPAKGYAGYTLQTGNELGAEESVYAGEAMKISQEEMENKFFRLRFNEYGQFSGIYDKRNDRELLPPGSTGNVLMTYEDKPHEYDAWNINHYYREKSWEVKQLDSLEILEEGPLRACVKLTRTYLDSRIEQYIYMYRDNDRIDIRHEIDWKEKQILLRELYPVDIHANEASYEIQFGNLKRPTHKNTSWDFAKFEVCAHKWMDISENGYGFSVLNDCKYGCDIHQGIAGVTLLKSAVHPNVDADREHHSFVISLYPHRGDFTEAETIKQAYALNNPFLSVYTEGGKAEKARKVSFVTCKADNVVLETVKGAEDGSGIIARVYECFNRRGPVELCFDGRIASAAECNLLEEEEQPVSFAGNSVSFSIKPYEIRTFKVYLE